MAEGRMFVLVHGIWHGGWCWKKLTPILRSAGHDVFAPTLTGFGERSHLLAPEIGLDTHIQDVVNLLEYEDLADVILVGHSYAGMVISGVVQRVVTRIAELVYLDAFLPEHGKSQLDYRPALPTRADGWRVPPIGPPQAFGVTNERDAQWVAQRLGDTPLKCMMQPVDMSARAEQGLRRTYIQCTLAPHFVEAARRAKGLGFRCFELLSAGHDAMISQPNELASLLLGRIPA